MKRWGLALVVLIVWGGSFLSCGSETGGSLDGSLEDYYDLSHSQVRVRLYSSELSIEYLRDDGEVPVRVTLQRARALRTGTEYDLLGRGNVTGRSRDSDIPKMTSGKLQFTAFSLKEGDTIEGEFDAKFEVGQNDASLVGTFEAKLEVVEVKGYEPDLGYLFDLGVSDMGVEEDSN